MINKNLNKVQKNAVKFKNGPLLIIAGAGTGKTTVITERIKHLIIDKKIEPDKILALTFTEKASFEMQERVDILLPYGYTNMWINTFHAFCDRVLRDEAHRIGLDPNFKQISETESILFIRENLFELGLKIFKPQSNPNKFLEALLTHFSRLKDEDITPEEYIRWTNKQKTINKNQKGTEIDQYVELAGAYEAYEKLKIKHSLMDFSDLISNTLLLFRKRPDVLKKYQNRFKFILVDEFQDTNYSQNELAILLSGDDKNITVVADDDQSIYRFRGAAVSNVLQFKKNFPKVEIMTLTKNYRSTQTILDASYKLIQNNNPNRLEIVEGVNKKLISNIKGTEPEIEYIHELKSEDEAEKIALTIKKLTKKNYLYNDVAILVRANNHAQTITQALQRLGIPFQFLGPSYLFNQDEIKDLISYLKFLTDPMDSVSLFRVLSMDIFNISYLELVYLLNFAKKKNISLFEALNDTNQSFLNKNTQEKLIKFKEMSLRHLTRSKKDSAGQILYYFLIDSGIFQTFQNIDSAKDERRIQNIAKFFDRLKRFETERSESNIFTVTEWLNLMMQMGDSPTSAEVDIKDRNAVNIFTVHSSKGLEFEVVFLVNLVSDRFPSRERAEKIPLPEGILKEEMPENANFHLQEERRLFYVGMTRAKKKLYFTAADYYAGGKRMKKISPFVFEAVDKFQNEGKLIKKSLEKSNIKNYFSGYEEDPDEPEQPQPYKIKYLTYSNLQMFDICPLHYRAKAILNIPTPIAHVQSFGISLHNSLYKFYKFHQEKEKLNSQILLKILKNEWINEGYINKKHENERFGQAKKILKNFYKNEYNKSSNIIGLELPFNFMLKNEVKVFGKIDRVDKVKKGLPDGRQRIEIIDYKTGADNPKADKAHKLQLSIYALAAIKVKDPIFNQKPEDITLTIHFLEGNTKKSMKFSKEDLEKFELELMEKIIEIENSDFKCSGNILCKNCEFKMLCNA